MTAQIQAQWLTQSEALERLSRLPEKFKNSTVGMVYLRIAGSLSEAGTASATELCAALFPELSLEQARRKLSSQYINRTWRDASGQAPIELHMTRVNAKNDQAVEPLIGFIAMQTVSPTLLDPASPRLNAAYFTSAQAEKKTSEEDRKEQAKESQNPRIKQAEQDMALGERALKLRELHGLRAGIDSKNFQAVTAQREATYNIVEINENELDESGRRPLIQSEKIKTDSVIALHAMLDWALAKDEKGDLKNNPSHRLLALLGDYGTGKTSHSAQFCRVLNGQVQEAHWDQLRVEKHSSELPKAQFIDLGELADVSNLPSLSLGEMLSLILRKKAASLMQANFERLAEDMIAQARAGQLIFVFDGLDELLRNDRSVLTHVFNQLMRVLEPSQAQIAAGQSSRARAIVSCRTHYFRDAQDQRGFLNTRQRGVAQASDYLRLTLLPWSESDIQSYLSRRLSAEDAQKLLGIIQSTYNLAELASRPVLLAMMSEQLGELLRQAQSGQPITAAGMYGITVSEWLQRDSGKHRLRPHHKALLMGALASAMWGSGEDGKTRAESWSAEQLDRWLLRTAKVLFPDQYAPSEAQAIQDDLRTATFIVRPSAERFSFAHRSFAEYFLARFIWDALELARMGELSDQALRILLPQQPLNSESEGFLKDIWAEQSQRHSPEQLGQLIAPVWRMLQEGSDAGDEFAEASSLPKNASPLHGFLWKIAVFLKWFSLPVAKGLDMQRAINLRGLNLWGSIWQDIDFRAMPILDCRNTTISKLRAHHCQFGVVICNKSSDWQKSLLRNCETSQIQWGRSIRSEQVISQSKTNVTPLAAQTGAWRFPTSPHTLVLSLAVSPDGRSILTGSYDGSARLWSCSGRLLRVFKGHRGMIKSVAFSPDAQSILTGSEDGSARLWSCNGSLLHEFEGHAGLVHSVAFSPDGQSILTGSHDGYARHWNCSGSLLHEFSRLSGSVLSVAFSPDGQSILTGSADASARLWSRSGKLLCNFMEHTDIVNSVAFSPDGLSILTGSYDGRACLWSCSGQLLWKYKGREGFVNSIAFSPDGLCILTGSIGGGAQLWSRSGNLLCTIKGNTDWVNLLMFSPIGKALAFGSDPGVQWIEIDANYKVLSTRWLVHGEHAPSTALFDADGNLLDWDDEAEDTWLVHADGHRPEGRSWISY